MRPLALAALQLLALTGCTTASSERSLVGRPVAEAVARLGPPIEVADYYRQGRFFTFSLSEMTLIDEAAANPANWLDPMTRLSAPETIDEQRHVSLPPLIVSPPYQAPPCTLTVVAEWAEGRKAWVAQRLIRRDAAPGGHCGPNLVVEAD